MFLSGGGVESFWKIWFKKLIIKVEKLRNLRHQDPFFHEVAIWPFHPPNTHSSPFYFQENDLLKLSKISHIDIFFFRFNKKLRTSQLVLFAICNDYLTVNSNCTIKCKLHLDKNWNSSSKRNWISLHLLLPHCRNLAIRKRYIIYFISLYIINRTCSPISITK